MGSELPHYHLIMTQQTTAFDLDQTLKRGAPLDDEAARMLGSYFAEKAYAGAGLLVRQDDAAEHEILLLEGRCVSYVLSPDGEQVHLGFFEAPAVLPPHISRTKNGRSLFNIELLTPGRVATIRAASLLDLMVQHDAIRAWGNQILGAQLLAQSTHQWALAALDGAARLLWLRENFDHFEKKFEHWRLASFLAMTPVSFSRIRNSLSKK